ncbi:PAS/PAC sensor hybrid histidine kinase [Loktanella sp. PT4BL]|jgi:hypothetical protein|uniref:PAS domain S-box protein n=1 Tax=Loktanella sp. PT4BL TaxID=2135611 RepID=UPI000D76A223|nr:PAS domain S-box protein [Loktanella sp. PT4BL]PXW67332.1 PAS/PAC sensor hybrid histidine kinase [Loktanella sp. PT4BL]
MFEPSDRESQLEAVTIRVAIGLAFILTFIGLILVAYYYGVIRDSAQNVRNADSDNVTWTVVQTEVDLQNLQLALSRGLLSMQKGKSPDISEIRRAFDIYYSRTNAVQFVYGAMAGQATNAPGLILDRLNRRKIELAEVIDGWDEPSIADVRDLLALVDQSDDDVRSFTTEMLKILVADTSDARLDQLGVLSRFTVLLGVIVVLVFGMLAASLLLLARLQKKEIITSSIADNLRRIVETSRDAVIIADSKGLVLQYNRSAHEIFGYTAQEAIGASMEDLFIPEAQKAAHQKGMARYLRTGQKSIVDQGRQIMIARNKSGREFPVEVTVSESTGRSGKTIFIGILRDISARIARDIELREALEEAKKEAAVRERFLAVMSHEMRTPLQGVLATFDLLNDQVRTAAEKSLIKLGEKSGTKALEQINKTLEIVQLNESVLFENADIIDPVASLQNMLVLLQPLLQQKSNTIELEFSTERDLKIIGNQYLFDALFDNLLSNANKFTKAGHISVQLQTTIMSDQKVELVVRVADSGAGIVEEDLASIFDDFKTSHDTYTRSFEGTGLGLGIVKRCSKRMGGEITVGSQLGVGSVFSFRCVFKIADGQILETQGKKRPNVHVEETFNAQTTPPLVLIVDDNEVNYTMIGKMLEKLGCRFDYAEDGLAAIQKCIYQSYDLILMDLSMPNLNGIEATPLIRKIGEPQKAIVCISAHNSQEVRNSVCEAGMDELLQKPLRLGDLAGILKRTIESKQEEKLHTLNGARSDLDNTEGPICDLFETFNTDEMLAFITSFDTMLRGDITQVRLFLKIGNHMGAAELLHRSAGSAGMIGAKQLSALLVFLEDRAKAALLSSEEPLLDTCVDLSSIFMAQVNSTPSPKVTTMPS